MWNEDRLETEWEVKHFFAFKKTHRLELNFFWVHVEQTHPGEWVITYSNPSINIRGSLILPSLVLSVLFCSWKYKLTCITFGDHPGAKKIFQFNHSVLRKKKSPVSNCLASQVQGRQARHWWRVWQKHRHVQVSSGKKILSYNIVGVFFIQGGFFNSPPPKISKCRPVTKFFKKKLEYPDWPPPKISRCQTGPPQKVLSVSR